MTNPLEPNTINDIWEVIDFYLGMVLGGLVVLSCLKWGNTVKTFIVTKYRDLTKK